MTEEKLKKIKAMARGLDYMELIDLARWADKRVKKMYQDDCKRKREERVARVKALPSGSKALVLGGELGGRVGEIVKHGRTWCHLTFENGIGYKVRYYLLTDEVDDPETVRNAKSSGSASRTLNSLFGV